LELLRVYSMAAGRAEDAASVWANPPLFAKGWRTRSGQLWFPTLNGVLVADPIDLAMDKKRAVLILEDILVDGTTARGFQAIAAASSPSLTEAPLRTPLRIGPGKHRVELHYTCPRFGEPDKLRFRYRMEGLDQDWVEAGTARTAQYNYLPPGDYHFSVAVCEPNGISNSTGVALSVSPYFWQRGWVISAVAVSLLAAVAGGARVVENRKMKRRLRRLEQQNALERERTRIAQDLHDEMGAKLCRISFLSEHASRLDSGSGEIKEQISSIADDSRKLLHSLDEIVWVVNPHNDTLEHVASYLAQYAQEYFHGTGIECELDISRDLPQAAVSSQTRHHLFLAVHEALTNVLKHSGAAHVKVVISCVALSLSIQVHDDGKGFVRPVLPVKSANGEDAGNGLPNMHQRIAAIGGQCRVESALGRGTIIEFFLELKVPAKEGEKP
jgi:signal transduction histidine kinase